LDGFSGSIIRGKVRAEAQNGMKTALEATKTSLQRGTPQGTSGR
jgi:hypothetical protein